WATRDAAARLAVRRHLPTTERAHFSQYKSAQTLYDAVVARYSSPATAALSRLFLPYLFPDLAAFPTVADLITHLRTSDTHYRAALPAEFCAKNPPPIYLTLYYVVTRLPDSLRVVRDHFLSVCPTTLTVDLLEERFLAAEQSIVAVGASRGDPRTPIFEGCSPSPLLPSVASAAAADLGGFESGPLVVTRAPPSLRDAPPPPFCPLLPLLLRLTFLVLSRSVRRLPLAGDAALARARGAEALDERAGAVVVEVEAAGGVGVVVGVEVEEEVLVAAVEAEAAAEAVGAEVSEEAAVEAAVEAVVVAEAAEAVEVAGVAVELVAGLRRGVASVAVSATSSSAVVRPCPLSSSASGTLHASGCGGAHPTQRCFGRLTDAWRRQFPEASEIPRWGELSRAGVAIYDLDFDAILSAMYAVYISDEGDCYRCFPPDPGIETASLGTGEAAALGACDTAALGASASASSGTSESALSGTTSASASLTFTLDSGASRSFFRDRTTLTPLSRPVAVSLVDPSGGPVLSHFSTVLPCPAAPSGTLSGLYLPSFSTNLVSGADLQDGGVHQFTPACQRVTHCSEASTGRHLATFTRQPGSSLYTLTTPSPSVAESGRVAASGQVFAAASRSGPESAPCSCRPMSHETLLWHHRLGHPSLLRLRGMASRLLVSGLPRSLPPLPQGPGPTCVPCVEGRQRAAPHSSQFPPTEAPLQTLHMDVWGPARVRGQGHERYFLLVVDDYSRYTSVFPLRSKGDVTEVLIDWIRAARLQLRQSFGSVFPVLRLHSDRGGEFSSGLLGAYCRARGIRQTFTLPDSPQQNGIAERRIGMVMDVARTSMMHAAAPHFTEHVLQRFGFTYSSPQATPLSTRHSLSALPSDESVESSGPYPELVGCLTYLMTCTRPDLAYPLSILARYVAPGRHRPEHMAAAKRVLRYLCSTSGMGLVLGGRSPVVLIGHADASWADDQATQRSSQGYTFSLGSGSFSWRATRSSSVLGSSCEAEIYAGAMAAQELRWLTYLLTDLGEPPRSPPVLYVDNKAMLALCREQRLEHRTKHIALRYFLARELQQRGQLRLAYVASEANTADVFTKALAPCDHQRFCTQLGLVPVLPHLLTS
ncbi:unnamed protein product, partial [Closterium sp. NIES-54]